MTLTIRHATAIGTLLLATTLTATLVAQDETPMITGTKKTVPALDAKAPKQTRTATFALG